MDCLVCRDSVQKSLSPVYDSQTQEAFSIWFCAQCGTGQTWPQPQDLTPYYSSYYGNRHGFTAHYCVRRRMAWVKQMSQGVKGRLLDIGCGEGTFLQQAALAGWQVAGIERQVAPARAAGFEVEQELHKMKHLAPFDCITLWHSLEHLTSPQAMLQQAHALLAPKGLVIIAVPNAQGWQARLFGAHWLHYDVPRHLYHFGPVAMQALLQAQGFEPVRWWHQELEYDVLGWSQSALNCLFSPPQVFFDLLTGRPTTGGWGGKVLNWLGGWFLSVLALPLVPLSAWFKAGGTVVVAARRQ